MSCLHTSELAILYFPNMDKESARRNFTKMIRKNAKLHNELISVGWSTNLRIITPLQLNIIYAFLGKP